MRKTVFVWLLAVGAMGADARELHWRELAVRAQLRDDGALRIEERHTMVFTGDWNGGERIFRVEPHQRLTIHGLSRGDQPLHEGSLDTVDRYALMEDNTLRWRARSPSDPEFERTELVYTIDYSLENALLPDAVPGSRRYALDHDFAFADRTGRIERFSLELVLGGAWHSPEGHVLRRNATNLLPGENYAVKLPLEFRGTGVPSTMGYVTALGRRLNRWLIPVPMFVALALFLWRERRRNAAVEIDRGDIDDAWLERNVLRHRPEVAGLFLHGDVGPPEVAALLARMEQEGKIRTWVTKPRRRKPVLNLELLVPYDALEGAEGTLAWNLFLTHTETNTETIKKAYRKSGFDPPSIIRDEVLREARTVAEIDVEGHGSNTGGLLIFGGVAGVIASAVLVQPSALVVLFLIAFGGIFLAILGVPAANTWRIKSRASGMVRLVSMPLLAGAVGWLTSGWMAPSAMLSLAAAWLGVYLITLSFASNKLSPEAVAIRKTMRRARRYFQKQLGEERPAIRDEWTPWLIAMGLDGSIASWWRAHAGKAAAASSSSGSSFGSSSTSSSWSSSPSPVSTFSGGGGSFGGAGASGT